MVTRIDWSVPDEAALDWWERHLAGVATTERGAGDGPGVIVSLYDVVCEQPNPGPACLANPLDCCDLSPFEFGPAGRGPAARAKGA